MPTPTRTEGSGSGLRTAIVLAVILLAIHNLWPAWAPNTPRPWGVLLTAAVDGVRSLLP
ncbi:MAG TPA: hypothetical protein VEA44_18750 [Caulobacter sp.]|nr:hypothetical protein [Caulobacter sp.]